MHNFNFYNPTQIIFGQDTLKQLPQHLPENARVMLLMGGNSAKKNGTLAEVKAALGQIPSIEFNGIEPNPTFETLMQAVDLARAEKINFLLAVGGGSVIDGTKFVAAAVHFTHDPWQILTSHGSKIKQALPMGTVLTLPATGSEMNCFSVITRKATQDKLGFMSPFVYPQFSILDPTKTYTLPPRQLANGLVDAFVHIMEQYLTYPVNALVQDRFAEGLLQTLIEIAPKVLEESPPDYETRANFMWVATMALNGLIGAGVPQDWTTHMIGHELTGLYDIDHARTLAMVLPSVMKVQRQQKHAKLLQYAERVWQINDGCEAERIDLAILKTQNFFLSLQIPIQLRDYQLGQDAIDAVIAKLQQHQMTALGEHQDINLEKARQILIGAL